MSYFFNDDSNQNEIYENEFFYNLGLEFPLSRKVYSYKNKVSYSKEKKIWFIRYKQNNDYVYLFGYNYGNDKKLDTQDPILILKFNLFNNPNTGNAHFAVDNNGYDVRAVMNIQFKNYHSNHKSENLKSISPIIVDSTNYLDIGSVYDSKELCENIELLLDEIESTFFLDRYLNRIKSNTPIKNNEAIEKQKDVTIKIKEEKKISEKYEETQVENIEKQSIETIYCDFCGSEILNEDPFKICKACRIRISNYLDLLCVDFNIGENIPIENLLKKASENKLIRKDIEDITTTLMKYKFLHKIDNKILIDYNDKLRNFIDKYSTQSKNKKENIENKVIIVTEKVGFNTPFDREYLKETLNFKNSEISKMIKYLEERNAIIEDEGYYYLVDKSNEINGLNDNIRDKEIKTSEDNPTQVQNIESTSNDKKTTIELNTKNKKDIDIFYAQYEKVLTFMKYNVPRSEIASKLGITEIKLNTWLVKGEIGRKPYKLLYDGMKKIQKMTKSRISEEKWEKILEDIKYGFTINEATNRADIPYIIIQFYLTNGEQGKKDYKRYYEEYQDALNNPIYTQDEIKKLKRCQLCNEILSDETKDICKDCKSKKNFAKDLIKLMEKLKYNSQFTTENLTIYYNDNEILKLINKLKLYDLILEDTTMNIFYFKEEEVEKFLNTYYAENKNYKFKSDKSTNSNNKKRPKNIVLPEYQNIPYLFKGINEDHTFIHRSGSSSKFTLEDVILIHKNYYEDYYSIDKISEKMKLSELTIKKLIVRYDEGDFDKYIKMVEDEKENNKRKISTCKSCKKTFEPVENEKYCKNCIITLSQDNYRRFKILLQTKPKIVIGVVEDKNFAEELCSIGKTELNKGMTFQEVMDNIQEIIIKKRNEEIEKMITNEKKPLNENHQKPVNENGSQTKLSETTSSKIKIITSMKKELIKNDYIKLKIIGKLPNNKIDSKLIEVLNKLKATERELKLIPLNTDESKIIFYIITKNNLTTKNLEILKKEGWHIKIKK